MNFDLTPAQTALQKRWVDFATNQLADDHCARDQQSEFSEVHWQRCAASGLLALNLAAEYGHGDAVSILDAVLVMEALGSACRDQGLLLAVNAQMWSVQLPIQRLGTVEQKTKFLPKLAAGEWKGAHAMTEPNAGSDAFGIQTTATKVDGGYRLNGCKCMVTLSPIADLVLVTAVTDASKGKWGLSTFVVERAFAGFLAHPADEKMGLRTVPFGQIELQDCFVPDSHRLGHDGGDVVALQTLLEVERCCILAAQIGAMERQLKQAVQYARDRRQFGKAIGAFQSVSNRIADMKVRLETCRMLLYRVAWLKSQERSAVSEAAMLKLYLSESFVSSSMDAMRIHGGRGYMTEFGVERDLRDAMGGVFYAGTSDIQRNVIAAMLGVG